MRKTTFGNMINRREFIRKSAFATGAAILGGRFGALHAAPSPGSATDWVPLRRKPGLKIPRLGIGTGSVGGSIQRNLGRDGFTRLIRHAYDQGVRYIDTADNYKTHDMIREAIKGIPRETPLHPDEDADPSGDSFDSASGARKVPQGTGSRVHRQPSDSLRNQGYLG